MFGDASQFLIQSINRHLGPDWAKWLPWSNFALADPTPTDDSCHEETADDT